VWTLSITDIVNTMARWLSWLIINLLMYAEANIVGDIGV
jgi:hypothetical protein